MTHVFGTGSPEWNEAGAEPAAQAQTDFVGIAIHCAQSATRCAGQREREAGRPDESRARDNGFQALFGAKYVNPAITDGNSRA